MLAGGVAPGTPSAAMIMEGLETLVAPSHHAFLLTESAAAAHFNVLSFDTCLFKTTAQTSPSTAATSAASYLSTPSHTFGGGHLGAAQTLLHYNLSTVNNNHQALACSSSSSACNTAAANNIASSAAAGTNSALSAAISRTNFARIGVAHNNNSSSNSNSSNNSCNTVATAVQQANAALTSPTITASAVTAANNSNNNSNNSGRNSATHLSLLNTTQHSPASHAAASLGGIGATPNGVDIASGVVKQSQQSLPSDAQCGDTQTGDLNTPVTTSNDIPSFFGPSTIVEPPPITGKKCLRNILKISLLSKYLLYILRLSRDKSALTYDTFSLYLALKLVETKKRISKKKRVKLEIV